MTAPSSQAEYDARSERLAAAMAALPPAHAEFVRRWRRAVSLLGRAGPTGCELSLLEAFVADVAALAGAAAPERVAGSHAAGTGRGGQE